MSEPKNTPSSSGPQQTTPEKAREAMSLPPENTPPPADPSAYVTAQADAAKRSISRVIAELKSTLTGGSITGEPEAKSTGPSAAEKAEQAVGDHPYAALGGAVAAGFLASAIFVPSKEQQVLRKLAALERAVALHGTAAQEKKLNKGLTGTLMGALASTLKPALMQALSAGIAAKTASNVADNKTDEKLNTPRPGESNGHSRHPAGAGRITPD